MSIELNYKKAPYFELYKKKLKRFYEVKWDFLSELNHEMLLFFLEKLGISVPVVRMKDFNFRGRKSELVLDMCRQLGADVYIFGENGKDYADINTFHASGIIPIFQEYNHPIYPQMHGDFIPYLSVIDLLFNCGADSLSIIMANNLKRSDLVKHEVKF